MKFKKFEFVILVFSAAIELVGAVPSIHHRHQHNKHVERSPNHVTVVEVPGPTVLAYELNGQIMQEAEVCKGIAAGTLKWASGNGPSGACANHQAAKAAVPVAESAPPSTAQAQSTSGVAPLKAYQKPSSQAQASQPSTSAKATSAPAPASSSSSSTDLSSGSNTNPSGGEGLDKPFPDNEIDCDSFPSEYGPLELSWLGFGGWSGVQYPTISGDLVTDIVTAVKGGRNCSAGAMCSYACPPGYQKSQWPSTQGSTGQSVGGLHCNQNNKLVKTNPDLSEYLCIKGTGATQVRNTMNKNAAICRTDYPGE